MAHFRRSPIIVPIDYSDAALRALRTALTIAPAPSDVSVVHVFDEMSLIGVHWNETLSPEQKRAEGLTRMALWLAEHNIEGVQQEVLIGDAGLEIADYARQARATLIVVPSHGRHGLQRLLLGSVTERIVRYCDCPVLVLRHDQVEPDSKSLNWLPRQRVIVPVDFSESSPAAAWTAIELVDSRTNVDAIHVVVPLDHLYAGIPGEEMPTDAARRDERQQYLERYLAERDLDIMRAHAIIGDPGTAIVDYANEHSADLIVIPSHGYHGVDRLTLGSVAERVLRHAQCAVLVLRRHDAQ